MIQLLIVMVASLAGGVVQSVTGFGAAILIMVFMPLIFSMTAAPAISDVITMTIAFAMFWRYRKAVSLRKMPLAILVYLMVSTFAIHQSAFLNTGILKLSFGIFLVILAGYFLFFSGKAVVKDSLVMNMLCGGLGGLCGGLFGIAGPPVSLYYLAVSKNKEEYLGTMNAFFSITVIFNVISRIRSGFLTVDQIPYVICGIAAIQIGCVIGSRISGRIDMETMKKYVYALMIFAGMISTIQGIVCLCGISA